jgi:hypothetical protein
MRRAPSPKQAATLRAPRNVAGLSVNRVIASRPPSMLDWDWLSLGVREQERADVVSALLRLVRSGRLVVGPPTRLCYGRKQQRFAA